MVFKCVGQVKAEGRWNPMFSCRYLGAIEEHTSSPGFLMEHGTWICLISFVILQTRLQYMFLTTQYISVAYTFIKPNIELCGSIHECTEHAGKSSPTYIRNHK